MKNNLNITNLLKPVPKRAVFEMQDWFIWGGSVVNFNNKYHMFFSRWPREKGFKGWVTHSEIAYATSRDPLGPFEFQTTILSKKDDDHWDADVLHNPNIIKYNKKLFLYYTGNRGNGKYYNHRNNQRIGLAVADKPEGPWKRFNKPLIDVSTDNWDSLLTTNPSCCITPDGNFLMLYKAATDIGKKNSQKAPVYHGVALAENARGPFKKNSEPILTSDDVDFPGEDPYVWYYNDRYYLILKDMGTNYTNNTRSLVLFESFDGSEWNLSNKPLVTDRNINFEDWGIKKLFRVERPQLLIIDGEPTVLYCAVKPEINSETSYNIHIPLR